MQMPHPKKGVAAHTIAWIIIVFTTVEGVGYAYGGNGVATTPSYLVLSAVPGGMRTWGVLLLASALAIAWGIGRDSDGHPRALNATLAAAAGLNILWASAIFWAWYVLHAIPAWSAPSKALLLVTLSYACARAVAPHGSTWIDKALHWAMPLRAKRERG